VEKQACPHFLLAAQRRQATGHVRGQIKRSFRTFPTTRNFLEMSMSVCTHTHSTTNHKSATHKQQHISGATQAPKMSNCQIVNSASESTPGFTAAKARFTSAIAGGIASVMATTFTADEITAVCGPCDTERYIQTHLLQGSASAIGMGRKWFDAAAFRGLLGDSRNWGDIVAVLRHLSLMDIGLATVCEESGLSADEVNQALGRGDISTFDDFIDADCCM